MVNLIIAAFYGILEFLLEVFSYMPFDWPDLAGEKQTIHNLPAKCFFWSVIGGILGALTIYFFPHRWIPTLGLKIVNVILAPVASAYISQALARRRLKYNPYIIPRNHFWKAFWFTFALVWVRFIYALLHHL